MILRLAFSSAYTLMLNKHKQTYLPAIHTYPNAEDRAKISNILKEGRKARQSSVGAPASDKASATPTASGKADASDTTSAHSQDDNASSICWFCHADVTNLANNKCAGCRKVRTHLCLQILTKCLFQARYCDERCQKADWGRHGDYCVKVQEKIRKKIEAKNAEQEIG